MKKTKETKRIARHKRLRAKVRGITGRPRLVVHRSLKNIYLQLIDDIKAETILSMSTSTKNLKSRIAYGGNVKAASLLGELFAQEVKEKGIKKIAFDRGGYLYHGRVKALAESLRKGGLEF